MPKPGTNFKESLTGRVLEAGSDKSGKEWDVVLIEEGMSQNGRYYPREVIEKISGMVEGLPAYTYTAQDLQDHLPEGAKDERPYGLVGNLVGWFSEPRLTEVVRDGVTRAAVTARMHIDDGAKWLRDKLRDAWTSGKGDLFGLSIDAQGTMAPRLHEGRMVDWVTDIGQLESADVVTFPAAKGRFERLVASIQESEGTKAMDKIRDLLIRLIESINPDLLESVDRETVEADAIFDTFKEAVEGLSGESFSEGVLKSRLNRAYAHLKADEVDKAEVIFESILDEKAAVVADPAPKPAFTADPVPVVVEPVPAVSGGDDARMAAIEERLAIAETQATLKESLVGADLPDVSAQRVKMMFAERVADAKTIREAIDQEKGYLDQLGQSGKIILPGQAATVRESDADKLRKGLQGFFRNEDVDGIPRFSSFRRACVEIIGDPFASPSTILRQARKTSSNDGSLRESLKTSDLGDVLGTAINNELIREYSLSPLQAWREVVSDITSVSSFQAQPRSIFGGYADLASVAEQATYASLTSPTDDSNSASLVKYGGIEDITMEAIANDNVGFIRRIPTSLARAAVRTLYKAVFDVFADNTATAYDGSTLFHGSAHSNSSTDALTQPAIETGEVSMRSQTAYGTTAETLGVINKPVLVLVPNELKSEAFRITESDVYSASLSDVQSAASEVGQAFTVANPYKGLRYMVIDHWTDATDWVLVADKALVPGLEVGFFEGRQEPELFIADQQSSGGSTFTADKIQYKIRHIWYVLVLDYRPFFKAVV